MLAPVLYLLTKLKFVVVFGKVGVTGLSMLISVWVYAAVWGLGWAAAVGFVALLFVHEMGHWLMMRYKGVPATAPLFIPFLGAVIGMRGMPNSVQDEAAIGIAGPLAGTAGALPCLGLARLYGGHLWPLLAMIGLFLNLFNLLPVSPLATAKKQLTGEGCPGGEAGGGGTLRNTRSGAEERRPSCPPVLSISACVGCASTRRRTPRQRNTIGR